MKIYLVRHGRAEHPSVDPQRSLSNQGKVEVTKLAHHLKKSQVSVSQLRCSTKERAKQTAKIIGAKINTSPTTYEGMQPNDPVDPVARDIDGFTNNIMLVGHLPFLPTLAEKLSGGNFNSLDISLPTAGMLVLEKNSDGLWILSDAFYP